jgi:hypothetical protein
MRKQMSLRIPGYGGCYPWWAYTHFLDLRFYRWHWSDNSEDLVRLALAVPIEKALLSRYGDWHCVLNRNYVPMATDSEKYGEEFAAWCDAARSQGVNVFGNEALPEAWEDEMRASWERIFDLSAHQDRTIQATFECLELADVVEVTEFTSKPGTR